MTQKSMKTVAMSALSLAVFSAPAFSQTSTPEFAHIFTDHAVLQRDQDIRVWGTAEAGKSVSVSLSDQTVQAVADTNGRWQANFSALQAGGPYTLSVSDSANSPTQLNDIMIGDVYLCSGQSNMEFQTKYGTNAYNEVLSSGNDHIRFVNIARESAVSPKSELLSKVQWQSASPQTTGETSAVCYYMAKKIAAEKKITVGFIHSSWGGTVAQAWISPERLKTLGAYDQGLAANALMAKDPAAAKRQWAQSMQTWWDAHEPDAAVKVKWRAPKLDESDWRDLPTATIWEGSGAQDLSLFDGVIYYRTHISLTKAQAKDGVNLELGPIDDADTTWVNGTYVGGDEGWDTKRVYSLPAKALKAGDNVITVRVLDSGGGGGLYGDTAARGIRLKDGSLVPLGDHWKIKISTSFAAMGAAPSTPWLPTSGLSTLYNAMIAPIAPYNLKGVAWYQGESNTYSPSEYEKLLPALFADWRTAFKSPDLPFLIVQLADFGEATTQPVDSNWAELRDVQRRSVAADANAGLAVIIDIGDRFDIHPTQKSIVGQRLALNAFKVIYKDQIADGPKPLKATHKGKAVVIDFDNTDGGLISYSTDRPTAFELCDASGCAYASARIDGDRIILNGDKAITATEVRYAWAGAPFVTLYSHNDLPVPTFKLKIN